eukprot:GHUV01022555.1.p1 GENE.GHUV01022555.1~~GHUV01022555.1.p1  ORF type:complete len:512 (+),score=108.21 GHUV01022555.1:224-1759(+)
MGGAAAIVLLFVLCTCGIIQLTSAEGAGSADQEFACDAISKVPHEQQCSFVKANCASESHIPYAEWYYCNAAKAHVLLRWMYVGLVGCLLPLAFCLLGDTAEFYIAPIMAHVSQAIPKMRPRFAGVTFVALGNGAPDLSANIAAISSGEITLSAGALTGAAMFVQCIVAAELVALAGHNGIKCGGAMLRDVGVYCLAIFSVLLAFALGQVSRAFVGWAISLYVVYMIWVFAGDEWHQRGRPRPQRLDMKSLTDMLAGAYQGGGLGVLGPRPNGDFAGVTGAAGAYNAAGELEESLLPWADAEEAEDAFHPPLDFAQLHHPPLSRLGGAAAVPRGSTGSTLDYASTELSDLATASSGAVQQGSTPGTRTYSLPSSASTYLASPPGPTVLQAGQRPTSLDGVLGRRDSAAGVQPSVHHQVQQPHLLSLGNYNYIDPKTYKQLVWADLADDQEEESRLEREIAQQLLAGARRQQTASTPGGVRECGTATPLVDGSESQEGFCLGALGSGKAALS